MAQQKMFECEHYTICLLKTGRVQAGVPSEIKFKKHFRAGRINLISGRPRDGMLFYSIFTVFGSVRDGNTVKNYTHFIPYYTDKP